LTARAGGGARKPLGGVFLLFPMPMLMMHDVPQGECDRRGEDKRHDIFVTLFEFTELHAITELHGLFDVIIIKLTETEAHN